MFKIIKKGSGNFWHNFNNGSKEVNLSDWEIVLDSVNQTVSLQMLNGANVPINSVIISDVVVIDETDSSIEETFGGVSALRTRLIELNYTPYIVLNGFVPEAPIDGLTYGRKDAEWVEVSGGGSTPDATTTVKGKLKLAGDLAGTADLPTVPELANKQNISEKNASNGYVGLSGFQIAFKNHLNTITNYFANYNIGSRTYTFPDKSMTVAGTDDIPIVDATPTDGSSNAVSSNGVFDALANKQNTLTETNFGSFINGLTAKNTLVDADEVVSDDSADSNKAKKTTWLNVWTNYLKPKADALYQAILTDANFGSFSTSLTSKTTPVDADTLNLVDSADSNKAKKLSFANLKAWILSFIPTVITPETGIYYFNDFLGVFTTSTNDGNISSDGNVAQTTIALNSDTNKQGFANVNTTNATAGYGNIYIGNNGTPNFILGGGITSYETLIWLPNLSTSGERFSCLIGFSSGVANQNNSANNIAFLYDEGNIAFAGAGGASANWRAVTIDSTYQTFTNTGVAVNAGAFIKLRIVVNANASSVGFFIDNTLVATHTTNIPSGNTKRLSVRNYIQKSVGYTPRFLILDYVKLQQTFTTAR